MTEQTKTNTQLVITRVFDAPKELVFKAWTEPERLGEWWGPKGCSIEVKKFELRPGGIFHYYMNHPNGMEMWGIFNYSEIEPFSKLVFISSFSDPEGNITRGPFFSNWPLEIKNILTLEENNGKTTLTLTGAPINATEDEMQVYTNLNQSMQEGFAGTFDQLEDYLSRNQQ